MLVGACECVKAYNGHLAIADKQKEAYDTLIHEKIISDNLIDITSERLKARFFYQEKRRVNLLFLKCDYFNPHFEPIYRSK